LRGAYRKEEKKEKRLDISVRKRKIRDRRLKGKKHRWSVVEVGNRYRVTKKMGE
jgi:hypothetical protein